MNAVLPVALVLIWWVLIGSLVMWSNRRMARQWRESVEFVARALGLHTTAGSGIRDPARAEGRIEGVPLRIETTRGNKPHTRVILTLSGLPPGLQVRRMGGLGGILLGEGTPLGDPRFDETIWVQGTPLALAPLLGSETRRAVAAAFQEHHFALVDGELTFFRGHLLRDGPALLAICRQMLALAQALDDGRGWPQRVAAAATAGRVLGPRLRALALLQTRFRHHPIATTTFEACLSDPTAEIRVAAAGALGRWEPLVEVLTAPRSPIGARIRAAEALEHVGDQSAIQPLLLLAGTDPAELDDPQAPDLQRAARRSALTLQTRFGLVGRPGQLALVREEPGSLALADEGQLALATGPSSVTTSPTSSPGR